MPALPTQPARRSPRWSWPFCQASARPGPGQLQQFVDARQGLLEITGKAFSAVLADEADDLRIAEFARGHGDA